MSTLFVCYYYPPDGTPAARRLAYLTARAAERGPVYVVTANPNAARLPHVTATEVVPAADLRSWFSGGASNRPLTATTKQRSWLRPLLRLRQAFPFVHLFDDGGPRYRRSALAAARRLVDRHGITHLLTSFRPWADHLVARRLKRAFPHLHWTADFRDLPVDPIRADLWFPALQRWWGKRIVRTADELWCVSRGQRAQLAGWHPRIQVRYNPLLELPPAESAPLTDRFRIVYTGSLYPGLQTVAPLVRALRELLDKRELRAEELEVYYRGKDASVLLEWWSGLPRRCLDLGSSIPPSASRAAQKKATMLLLLNWSAPGYYGVLTAKLWDYLAAGRPVLALVNGPGDEELSGIFSGAGAGAVYATDEQAKVAERLRQWLAEWRATGTVRHAPDRAYLRQYL